MVPFLLWEVTDLKTQHTYTIQLGWDTPPLTINYKLNQMVESLHLPKSHKLNIHFIGDWGWLRH